MAPFFGLHGEISGYEYTSKSKQNNQKNFKFFMCTVYKKHLKFILFKILIKKDIRTKFLLMNCLFL